MKMTYFCVVPLQVGDEVREPGDLVPEAALWKHVQMHVRNCDIAPVLVCTLPKDKRDMLQEWEDEQEMMAELIQEAESVLATHEPEEQESVESSEEAK